MEQKEEHAMTTTTQKVKLAISLALLVGGFAALLRPDVLSAEASTEMGVCSDNAPTCSGGTQLCATVEKGNTTYYCYQAQT